MRRAALLLSVVAAGCPGVKFGDSGDTGSYATCCTFSCDDGTEGAVSFTVDASDCDAYALDQCSLAGAAVSSASFEEEGC